MITCHGRLPKALARSLAARGYRRLTPVQRAVLRVEAADADLLVSARTGSGKTVAYGLALARRLFDPAFAGPGGPRALVVTPTRELALQVREELAWLFGGTGVRIGCCTGGTDPRADRAALAAGVEVVVGTPGRLRDHIGQGVLAVSGIGCVVLDECDDMLDRDFRAELEAVLGALPAGRQTLMFSATIGPPVEALAQRFQTGAVRIDVEAGHRAGALTLQGVVVAPGDREAAVVNLLRLHEARAALVFAERRQTVTALAAALAGRGFGAVALSGALSQDERNAAVAAMRRGRARVCVATDLAARGIDLPGLDLVVHAELPGSAETLLHRSGRTGRAGRCGRAVLVVARGEERRARALAARAGLEIDWIAAPGPLEVGVRDRERMRADPALAAPLSAGEIATAADLLGVHGPERVAGAFVRLWTAARPAAAEIAGRPAPARRAGGVWFTIAADPGMALSQRELLRLICRRGRIPRQAVRRVRVVAAGTQVELNRSAARHFLAAIRSAPEGLEVTRIGDPLRHAEG